MCEFKVYLNGKKVFEDAVYAKLNGGNVTLKNILGETTEFNNCQITEINVTTEKLTLSVKEP
ncbi:MAG: CooT family nickel-binding protein [Candidatus Bathyarchaeota archaeon]